jgi:hypothetical protein
LRAKRDLALFLEGDMTRFATALATDGALDLALSRAVDEAVASLGGAIPKLAVVFASQTFDGIANIATGIATRLPGVPFVGGTSAGCVFDTTRYSELGLSVSLVGGSDLAATTRTVKVSSTEVIEVAAATRDLRKVADEHARDGRRELSCLAFAPSRGIIGDALVAAMKKGATTNAQLAGALVSSDNETSGGLVWSDTGGVSAADVVVAGLFTERPLGVSARHGWSPIGKTHRVTRSEGARLVTLDGRPAIDVWVEEARAHGGLPPSDDTLALYLASHYELAILGTEGPRADGEPIVRGSRLVNDDGSVELFGSVPEGAMVRLVGASAESLFGGAKLAATRAAEGAGGTITGALGLLCAGRKLMLGDAYREEPRLIAETLGVPFGGTTVNGEIALARRDANGFYNSTAVVIAFPE